MENPFSNPLIIAKKLPQKTPVIDVWKALPARGFPNYASGSWGPQEADDLMERDGRSWRKIGEEVEDAKCPAAASHDSKGA